MTIHPWTTNDIARMRSDEKLAQGLKAYRAVRLQDELRADHGCEPQPTSPGRLLDRLIHRTARAEAAAARLS